VGGGELLRLLGQVGRVADVRRQVAQFAGEGHALRDGLALGQGAGVLAGDGQLAQARLVLLAAQGGGVAVGGVVGGHHRLAYVPGGVAARHGQLAEGQQGAPGRAGLQRPHRVGHGLQVLRHAEPGRLAQADHQHARGGHPRQVVQHQAAAGAAAEVAALQQGAQAAAAGLVDGLPRGRERLVGEGAGDDAVEGGRRRGVAVQGELQGH
jgi:hypothetical protein